MEASARLAAACFAAASEAEAVKRSRSEPTTAFLQHQAAAFLHHEDDNDLGPLKVFGPSSRAREMSRCVDGPDDARGGVDVVVLCASADVKCAGQENGKEEEDCDKDLRGTV